MLAIFTPLGLNSPTGDIQFSMMIHDIHRTKIVFSSATNLVDYLIDCMSEEEYYTSRCDIIIWYQFEDYELRARDISEALYIGNQLDKGNVPTVMDIKEMREGVAALNSGNITVLPISSELHQEYRLPD